MTGALILITLALLTWAIALACEPRPFHGLAVLWRWWRRRRWQERAYRAELARRAQRVRR